MKETSEFIKFFLYGTSFLGCLWLLSQVKGLSVLQ